MSEPITRLNAALEGRYEIEREIGEGGMATVYLARDLKHNRNVAVKVLKPELAAVVGADRFLAEIETTANLQHPHILPLFDSGEADGFLFYVMPFIDGETLRDRLDREKQLPVEEAIGIATAVANALQTAHDAGVVHRDIKPGNILMSQGEPLVSDFGIALAVGAAGGNRLTETGLSVGTPYYMSPEQATGDQQIGPASDTYALACVLYEMLVGEPPYTGNTAQAVLGKIIMGEGVSATAVRKSIPANVDGAIKKALEKLPADRFTGAQEFAKALADPGFRYGETGAVAAGGSAGPWNRLSIALAALAAVLAVVAGWALSRDGDEPLRRVERFATPFLPGQEPIGTGPFNFGLSPDGSMVVYRWNRGDGVVLMVRRWDEMSASEIRETVGAGAPTVSPDGLEVSFTQGGEVKAAALAGGPVRTLHAGFLSFWAPDGFVYSSTDSGSVRVPEGGGAADPVSRVADGEGLHQVTDLLPGGETVLVAVRGLPGGREIRAVDIASGDQTFLVHGDIGRYLPTGHLVFQSQDGTMMAVRFDPGRLELEGTPVAVMDGARTWFLSNDGKLFYSAGATSEAGGPDLELAWVSRSGEATPLSPARSFTRGTSAEVGLSISPDGSMIVHREFSQGGYDIWLLHDDGNRQRLTFDDAHEKMPTFDPSGQHVTYLSDRNGNFDVWSTSVDGSGQPELLLDLDEDLNSARWSPDGEWIILWTAAETILGYRPATDSVPTLLLGGPYDAQDPVVSPDGGFIAYASDETGVNEVYVRPFPNVNGGQWQVSSRSARYPRWAHGGSELFFQDNGPSPSMWRVDVETSGVFRHGPAELMFDSPGWWGSAAYGEPFEVTPDDDRFLTVVSAERGETGGPEFVLVNNFFEELKRLVPE